MTCGITFTFGGLRINTDGEVLNTDYQPIRGLYAAGELVGGLFYFNYPGGSGLMLGLGVRQDRRHLGGTREGELNHGTATTRPAKAARPLSRLRERVRERACRHLCKITLSPPLPRKREREQTAVRGAQCSGKIQDADA